MECFRQLQLGLVCGLPRCLCNDVMLRFLWLVNGTRRLVWLDLELEGLCGWIRCAHLSAAHHLKFQHRMYESVDR